MSQVKIRDQMSIKTSCSDWLTRREYKSRTSNEVYRVTKSISDTLPPPLIDQVNQQFNNVPWADNCEPQHTD